MESAAVEFDISITGVDVTALLALSARLSGTLDFLAARFPRPKMRNCWGLSYDVTRRLCKGLDDSPGQREAARKILFRHHGARQRRNALRRYVRRFGHP